MLRALLELEDLRHQPLGRLDRGLADLAAAQVVDLDGRPVRDAKLAEPEQPVGPRDRGRHERDAGLERDPRGAACAGAPRSS